MATLEDAKQVIKAAAISDDTVLLESLHGVGKSSIVKQFAEEDDYHLETLFLSHQEVGDLIGIPHLEEHDGKAVTTWSVPIWLERINIAAWPLEFEMSDLIFHDDKFKQYVKAQLKS